MDNFSGKWLIVFVVAMLGIAVIIGLQNSSGIDSANIANGSIQEEDLLAIDIPADGEVATYDAASGGFEWEVGGAGGGGTHPVDLSADVSGTLPTSNGGTGITANPTSNQVLVGGLAGGWALGTALDCNGQNWYRTQFDSGTDDYLCDTDTIGGAGITDNSIASIDIIDGTIAAVDVVTGGITTSEILDGTILEVDLAAIDTPADGEIASYDSGSGGIEWIPDSGGGGASDNMEAHRAVSALNNIYFAGSLLGVNNSTRSYTLDVLYALPIFLGADYDADAVTTFVNIGGAAGALGRVCVYNDNGSTYPGSLNTDPGTFAADSSGYKTITFTQKTLPSGLYWVVYWTDTASVNMISQNSTKVNPIHLGAPSGQVNRVNWGWSVALTFTTCPANFPTGASLEHTVSGGMPMLGVRLVP